MSASFGRFCVFSCHAWSVFCLSAAWMFRLWTEEGGGGGTGGQRGHLSPHFSEWGGNQCKMPPLFRLGTFLSGVKMPKVSQIFKITWFIWLQIALFHA